MRKVRVELRQQQATVEPAVKLEILSWPQTGC